MLSSNSLQEVSVEWIQELNVVFEYFKTDSDCQKIKVSNSCHNNWGYLIK